MRKDVVKRYQQWLRDAVDGALEELEGNQKGSDGPTGSPEPPSKRVRFGDDEIREISAPGSSIAEREGAQESQERGSR